MPSVDKMECFSETKSEDWDIFSCWIYEQLKNDQSDQTKKSCTEY